MKAEPILELLTTFGIPLDFNAFTVLGIPGFDTQVLYKGETTLYEVERQNFSFAVPTLDCRDNNIAVGMQFAMEDTAYRYSFEVDRPPIADLTGFSEIHVIFVAKRII